MRIISGSARGSVLFSPLNNARPTLDVVRESLFNILAPNIRGAAFLDLFSGSGAVGIEALSRGANSAVFVDVDTSVVRKNLIKTKLIDRAVILKMDYAAAVRYLMLKGQAFDYVFADPPYNAGLVLKTAVVLAKNHILLPNGEIMIEYGKEEAEWVPPEELFLERRKIYSNCIIDFFRM